MIPELAAVCLGLAYSGGAVLAGLLLPLLWPTKDLTRANALLVLAYRLGLVMVAAGVASFVLNIAQGA